MPLNSLRVLTWSPFGVQTPHGCVRGRQPHTSLKVIVSLIAGTTTRKGLKVQAEIDDRSYPAGIKVPDSEMERLNLQRDDFHGEWNYEILPR